MATLNTHSVQLSYTTAGTTYTLTGRLYVDYTISNTDTTATITASMKADTAKSGGNWTDIHFWSSNKEAGSWQLNGGTRASLSYFNITGISSSTISSSNKTATITKTHSAQSIPVRVISGGSNQLIGKPGTSHELRKNMPATAVTVYISVPAKTSYTVSYNANNGTGAPASQTKWYGETLKLQTGTPTRTGYTFKGWSTSSTATSATYAAGANYTANANATLYAIWEPYHYDVIFDANGGTGAPAKQVKDYGTNLTLTTSKPTFTGYTFKGWATSTTIAAAGTVEYQSGGTYSANAAITLYAVWELTYQKPSFNVTTFKVERCDEYGVLDDEGTYALVYFDWTVFRTNTAQYYGGTTPGPYADNTVSVCSVTVGSYTETPTLTGGSGSEEILVGEGTFDSDTSYSATVTITDSQTVYTSGNTATISGSLALTFFPLDYNADATALGIFMPAPDSGDGAYFAKDINANSNIKIEIDTNAGSGSDYEIYQALVNLGWTDVLE